MKKLVSIVLSLLVVISCMTSALTFSASAATVLTSTVGNGAAKVVETAGSYTFTATPYQSSSFLGWYNGETPVSSDLVYEAALTEDTTLTAKFSDTNLIAGKINTDWKKWNATWGHITNNTTTTGDSYLGGNSVNVQSPSYQFHYFMVDLKPSTTYSFQTYINNYEGSTINVSSMRIFKLADAEGYTGNSDGYKPVDTTNSYYKTHSESKTISGWTAYPASPLEFTTAEETSTENVTYVIGIKFNNCTVSSGTCYANFSDWSLVDATKYTLSASSTGNGAIKVVEDYTNSYTCTATPYQSSEFLGWFNGETLVSADSVYEATITADTTLVAKFSDVNLLEGKNIANPTPTDESTTYNDRAAGAVTATEGWWSNSGRSAARVFAASTDSRYGGASICNSYVSNRTAYVYTMLLKPNTTYSIQFSFKSSTKIYSLRLLDNTSLFYAPSSGQDGLIAKGTSAKDGDDNTVGDFITTTGGTANSKDCSAWTDYSATFTTNASDAATIPYFIYFDQYNKGTTTTAYTGTFISDLSLIDMTEYTLSASSEGNGAAKASAATAKKGAAVTFTATPYQDSQFLGWYDGETLVSTSTVYETTATANLALTALFTDVNLIAGKINTDWKKWHATYGHITNNTTTTGDSYLGGNSVNVQGPAYQFHYFMVDLKPSTTYSFQTYINNYENSTINVGSMRVFKLADAEGYTGGSDGYKPVDTTNSYYFTHSEVATIDSDSWTAYPASPLEFTTAEETSTENVTYVIGIKFNNCTVSSGTCYANFSDWSLVEVGGEDINFADFKGNAIRSTGNQGLRYKYEFADDVIANGFKGYTVKEVGAVAIRTESLTDAELNLDNATNSGAFYSSTDAENSKIADDNTAAVLLYNIGAKKNPTTGVVTSTNYTAYGWDFTVRTYIVLEYNGREITLYGETVTASVFAVMDYIETLYAADSTNEQVAEDYASVQAFLASTTVDTTNGQTISEAYTAWQE